MDNSEVWGTILKYGGHKQSVDHTVVHCALCTVHCGAATLNVARSGAPTLNVEKCGKVW